LLGVIAQAEAYIDFPEEDLPPESVQGPAQQVVALVRELEALRRTHRYRSVLEHGVRTVILGAPNAGKSSLLNAFLGHERALVSAVPGTTRDFISEMVHLGPYCLRLVDTAGLRDSDCPLEAQGIRKTLDQIHEADLYVWVVDGAAPLPYLGEAVKVKLHAHNTLVVCNKSDLPAFGGPQDGALEALGLPCVRVSLLQPAEAMAAVSQGLLALLGQGSVVPPADEVGLVVNARHAEALDAAIGSLQQALQGMRARVPAELVASDLRLTLQHLEAIVGKVDQELILDKLFSQFCIGK
jgi:tRNA modification GTPase